MSVSQTNPKPIRTPDFLQRLGLSDRCTEKEVVDAYHRRAGELHPDRGGSKEEFKQLRDDYEQAKRYVHQSHRLQPPTKAGNAPRMDPTLANLRRHKSLNTDTAWLIRTAIIGFLVAAVSYRFLPMIFAGLGLFVGLASITAMLPKLPKGVASIVFVITWFFMTICMAFFAKDIRDAFLQTDDDLNWLLVLTPFAYIVITVIGAMSWLVGLVSK